MTDVAYLTIAESAELLRSRRLSVVELTSALLARIARHDTALHSFIDVDADRAMEAARSADADFRAAKWRGPLHGIAYAVKDLIDVAGYATTCHSRILADNVATRDATVITRLKEAGAIVIGKTALHEFATGGPSFDLPWPPARNPWKPSVHPGGSSSGSAVAVAAGFVPLGLGTDTAGSVRHPASVCGIVGMKPTFGAVALDGCFPLSFSLDHFGLLTRTVADNAIALASVLDKGAAARMGCRPGTLAPFRNLDRGLDGLRVGVIDTFHRGSDVNAEIAASTDAAVEVMKAAGARVSALRVSPLEVFTECGRTLLQSEAFAIHGDWLRTRPQDYGTRGRRRLLIGALIPAERYVQAQQVRTALAREFFAAMRDVDVAMCASSLELPCPIEDEVLVDRTYDRQARTPFNVLGAPAISVPAALSSSGLPIGIQIAGRPYGEAMVYRAAQGFEAVLDRSWRPPMRSMSVVTA